MFGYLSRLPYGVKILWCCLIWYMYFTIKYLDLELELWSRSLGIALLVGFVLNINAFGSVRAIVEAEDKGQVFRFFAIPFCVSSFPVLTKGKGFILFFSPHLEEDLVALSLIALFLSLCWVSKALCSRRGPCVSEGSSDGGNPEGS